MGEQQPDSGEKRRAREGRILFIVFATLIVVLIAAMFFIDMYAQDNSPGAHQAHDAADR